MFRRKETTPAQEWLDRLDGDVLFLVTGRRQTLSKSLRDAILAFDEESLASYGPDVVILVLCTVALTNMRLRYAADPIMRRFGSAADGPLRALQVWSRYGQEELEASFQVAFRRGNRSLSDEGAAFQANLAVQNLGRLADEYLGRS